MRVLANHYQDTYHKPLEWTSSRTFLHWLILGFFRGFHFFPRFFHEAILDHFGFPRRSARKKGRYKSVEENRAFGNSPSAEVEFPSLSDMHPHSIGLERIENILLVPHLVIGGADTYALHVARFLAERSKSGRTVILITSMFASPIDTKQTWYSTLPPAIEIVFLRNLVINKSPVEQLQDLLLSAKAKIVFCINSLEGLKVLENVGRRISLESRIYVTFFNMSFEQGIEPLGVKFASSISKFAVLVTDNLAAFEELEKVAKKSRVKLLRSAIDISSETTRQIRQNKWIQGQKEVPQAVRWLWLSRVDREKGTDLLKELAMLRPNDIFDCFGPIGLEGAGILGVKFHNINYCGILENIENADLTSYKGYLFTSKSEGMPRSVLEISQHFLPIVSTDVGDINQILPPTFIVKWDKELPTNKVAVDFANAMQRILAMSQSAYLEITNETSKKVEQLFSPDRFSRELGLITEATTGGV